MKTRIVRIGNSRGLCIPKVLLEKTGLNGEVDIAAEDNALIIRAVRRPREGWAEAFEKMAERGDDIILDDAPPGLSRWDRPDELHEKL